MEKTEKLLKQKLELKEFDSYAVFVYKNGRERFMHSDNVDADTYFDMASMGKILVTSPLVLKAIDEGKLSLSDTLGKFLENVPEDRKDITIEQLLTHTSGIVRCPISPESVSKGHDAVADFIIANPLAFAPGENMIYSCNGMILLGYVLEKLYSADLEKIFEEKLKKPFGYTRSKFNIELDEANAAICYRSENVDGLAHPWDDENIRVLQTSAGSGGQFFTMNDVVKYAKAVMAKDERLYSGELFDKAEQNYTPSGDEGRGLGWLYVDESYPQTGKLFGEGSFGHTGFTGMSIFFNRKDDMFVVMFTNATRFSAIKHNFECLDYEGDTCRIRRELHNAIFEDLSAEGLI